MRGPRLIHLWEPFNHCCEEKMESVNQIGKLRSESTVIKKLSIITEVPTITAFVAAFDAKALNCTELLESYLAGGIKTLKHNVRTTLQLACHGCKNLTHMSKTPHVKRTQMVVTVRFTIRVTSLPRWNKQGIKICDWFLAYYTCGLKLLECRYAQVWNIAKRRKQIPMGWLL